MANDGREIYIGTLRRVQISEILCIRQGHVHGRPSEMKTIFESNVFMADQQKHSIREVLHSFTKKEEFYQ